MPKSEIVSGVIAKPAAVKTTVKTATPKVAAPAPVVQQPVTFTPVQVEQPAPSTQSLYDDPGFQDMLNQLGDLSLQFQSQAQQNQAQLQANRQDAAQVIKDQLNQWGLGDLSNTVWSMVTQDMGSAQIVNNIRGTNQYKDRFKGNVERGNSGLTPLSEADYLAYENAARQTMRANGLPPGFYDNPADFNTFISNDVSISELNSRIQAAATVANNEPSDVLDAMHRLYGLDRGSLTAYMLDPARALPLIQTRVNAARAAGAAHRTGFGDLTINQAEQVAIYGQQQDTSSGFANLANMSQLFDALPGENVDQITTDQQIAAQFGNDQQQTERISRRQRARLAAFANEVGVLGSTTAGAIGAGTVSSR